MLSRCVQKLWPYDVRRARAFTMLQFHTEHARWARELRSLDQAIAVAPDDTELMQARLRLVGLAGQYDEIAATAARVESLEAEVLGALYRIGREPPQRVIAECSEEARNAVLDVVSCTDSTYELQPDSVDTGDWRQMAIMLVFLGREDTALLENAVELCGKFPTAPVIVTGPAAASEPVNIYSWLLVHGVLRERIHVDTEARDLVGCFLTNRAVLRARGIRRLLLIVEPRAATRAFLVANQLGAAAKVEVAGDRILDKAERAMCYMDLARICFYVKNHSYHSEPDPCSPR